MKLVSHWRGGCALSCPCRSWECLLLEAPAKAQTRARLTAQARPHVGVYACADTLLGNLTVYEMLAYTAELKNPMNEPFEQKAAKVEQVLQQLGLSGCRGVRIGSQLARGISGAQPLRRCLVGVTLFGFLVLGSARVHKQRDSGGAALLSSSVCC